MRKFPYIWLLLYFYHQPIEAININCQAKALPLRGTVLKANLEQSIYWTVIHLSSIEPPYDNYKYPIGFMNGENLVRTYIRFRNDEPHAHSYTIENGSSSSEISNDHVLYYKTNFLMDSERAIFKYLTSYTYTRFEQTERLGFRKISSETRKITNLTFALVHDGPPFRIYQSCDKNYAWVQIENKILKSFKSVMEKGQNNYPSDKVWHVNSIDRMEENIVDTLSTNGVLGNIFVNISEKLGDNFVRDFCLIHKAAIVLQNELDL